MNVFRWILILITVFIIWGNAVIKDDYRKTWKVNVLFIMYLIYLIIS